MIVSHQMWRIPWVSPPVVPTQLIRSPNLPDIKRLKDYRNSNKEKVIIWRDHRPTQHLFPTIISVTDIMLLVGSVYAIFVHSIFIYFGRTARWRERGVTVSRNELSTGLFPCLTVGHCYLPVSFNHSTSPSLLVPYRLIPVRTPKGTMTEPDGRWDWGCTWDQTGRSYHLNLNHFIILFGLQAYGSSDYIINSRTGSYHPKVSKWKVG